MDLTGKIFEDKYQIVDVLGKGGMSTVYLARDIKLQKFWAIKEVNKNTLNASNTEVDLMAETNILKKLDHPALPRIVDIIDKKNNIYVILDFIDGISLDRHLNEFGIMEEKTIVNWAKQICDVLDYLHSQKPNPIIYRDMKPGNLMLTGQGKIKLIDFGIAREYKKEVSADTTYIGTKGYAAPEQYGNHQTDARTDIYSLGVTLYHLSTGKGPNDPPFEIKPARQMNPLLSEGLEIIIDKCTQSDLNLRYQSVKELLYDFNNIHKLNSSYKNLVRVKLLKMGLVILGFIVSAALTINGVTGLNNYYTMKYNEAIAEGNSLKTFGKVSNAIDTYKAAINQDGTNEAAYENVIKTYLEMNQVDNCIDFIKTYIIDKKASVLDRDEIKYWIGMAYFQKGEYYSYQKANDYFSKITDTNTTGIEAVKFYKPISQALGSLTTLKASGEFAKSVNELEAYIDSESDVNSKINDYLTLAVIYSQNVEAFKDDKAKTNGTDKEITVLEKANALCINKDNISLYEHLGQAYYDKANQVKGDTSLDTDTLTKKYKDELSKALVNYKIAITAGSKVSDSYLNLGLIYKGLDNYDESSKTFLQETQLFPNDYKGYMELALLYGYIEDKKINAPKDYGNFLKYYNMISDKNPNKNDPEYIRLMNDYNDLKNQGLLK